MKEETDGCLSQRVVLVVKIQCRNWVYK